MKKIDTWLDIQRFLSGAEFADRKLVSLPQDSEEFIQVQERLLVSEIVGVRSVRRAFYTNHI